MGLLKELLREEDEVKNEKEEKKESTPKKEDRQLKFKDIKLGGEYITTATLDKITEGKRIRVVERKPFGAQLQIKINTVIGPKIEHTLIGDNEDEIDLK